MSEMSEMSETAAVATIAVTMPKGALQAFKWRFFCLKVAGLLEVEMKRPGLLLLPLCAALASCATYGDLKASNPVQTSIVMGHPAALADCYIAKRLDGYVENYQRLDLSGTLELVVRSEPELGTSILLYELSFTETAPGTTRVELRDAHKPLFDLGHSDQTVVDMVGSCGAKAGS